MGIYNSASVEKCSRLPFMYVRKLLKIKHSFWVYKVNPETLVGAI